MLRNRRRALLLPGLAVLGALGCREASEPPTLGRSTSQAITSIDLPVLGVNWTPGFGEATQRCFNPPTVDNPIETFFGQVGSDSVEFQSAAIPFGCMCCACASRHHDYFVGTHNTNDARLTGFFLASRTNTIFNVASMRIDLLLGGNVVANETYAAERRGNNNCTFEPGNEVVLANQADFNVALRDIQPNTLFDTIRVMLQGYACQGAIGLQCFNEVASNSVRVARLRFLATAPNGGSCAGDGDCTSGHCFSGGICCESTCAVPNASTHCGSGICQINSCSGGFGNCNGVVSDGCESSLGSDPAHCGNCFNSCVGGANSTGSCSNGSCNISCNSGFGSCDGNSGNGCETALNTIGNCGGCFVACNSTNGVAACNGGACQIACNPGFGNCDGVGGNGCEATLDSLTHCGACGNACGAVNGSAACVAGACQLSCNPGFADCNGNAADGCEAMFSADLNNCGACGVVCSSNHVPTPACLAGACSGACEVGWGDCDADRTVAGGGCETSLTAPPDCGLCGATCNDADACTNDVCAVVMGTGVCRNVPLTACGPGCSAAVGCGFADTDGDGLNDTWEALGYIDLDCNGAPDTGVDTPLPNADPNQPNIYVKFDYMVKSGAGAHSHAPSANALDLVRSAFAAQNVILTFDPTSTALPERRVLSVEAPGTLLPTCTGPDAASFYDPGFKPAQFPAHLRPVYHYLIFAHLNTCDEDFLGFPQLYSCGNCPPSAKNSASPSFGLTGLAERPGNDLIVSFGAHVDFGVPVTDEMVAGTLMHELGHNLGLRHGGSDDLNQKPHYFSVMNFSYQFGIPVSAAPGPYATGPVDPAVTARVDYSASVLPPLREGVLVPGDPVDPDPVNQSPHCVSDGSGGIDENLGVAGPAASRDVTRFFTDSGATYLYGPSNGTPIDWDNRAPVASDPSVYTDVSGDGQCSVLTGFEDWAHTNPAPGVTVMTNLQLDFQCNSGFWADGNSFHAQREDGETTYRYTVEHHLNHPFLPVAIDVRPGCGQNWIAPSAPGVVTVAALGAYGFEPAQVDPGSLRFAGARPAHVMVADRSGDGVHDLVADFVMGNLALATENQRASLSGALWTGQAFGGHDAVLVVAGPGPEVVTRDDGSGFSATITHALNHSLVPFTLRDCVARAAERCGGAVLDPNASGRIVRLASDEVEGGEHGRAAHTSSDVVIDGPYSFRVRRERTGKGDGRVYTVIFDVSDARGETTRAACRIQVPHSPASAAAVDSGVHACTGGGC